jgi:hypothetical protein
MTRTRTLVEIVDDGSLSVRFDDKHFGTPSLQDLEDYCNQEIEALANAILRSLLYLEYRRTGNLNISATLDTTEANGIWVRLNV